MTGKGKLEPLHQADRLWHGGRHGLAALTGRRRSRTEPARELLPMQRHASGHARIWLRHCDSFSQDDRSNTQPPHPPAIPAIAASHCAPAPSAWIRPLCPSATPAGLVLDLTCGMGRHTRFLLGLESRADQRGPRRRKRSGPVADIAETITADIENDAWPLTGRSFDGVVVTNYLWHVRCGRRF